MKTCPCGKSLSYGNCCGVIHEDLASAKTAEDLMRSRYTAFTMALGDYLMLSHHSTTRPIQEKKEIVNWAKSVQWNRLEIISITQGEMGDLVGFVEFKAYFTTKSVIGIKRDCIHEHSKFIRENGCWVYLGLK